MLLSCLDRIGQKESQVRAWASLGKENALARAKLLDKGAVKGLLHGLPIGIKDHIAVKGLPWPVRGHAPSEGVGISMEPAKEDSIVAERLRKDAETLLRLPDLVRRIEEKFPAKGGAPEAPPLPEVELVWERKGRGRSGWP